MTRLEAEILVNDLLDANFLYEQEDLPRSLSKFREDYLAAREAVITALVNERAGVS